jgi:N-methylhydantoinase B
MSTLNNPRVAADPVMTQVMRYGLETIADEMRLATLRTAMTVVVKDMLDYSCALFDRDGRMVATASGVPSLIASMATALGGVLEKWGDDIAPGDVFLTNDPYNGAAHTPDANTFIPVYAEDGTHIGFSGTIVHHADWGGRFFGTNATACGSIYEEGVVYPAVKLEEAGRRTGIYDTIGANVRNPTMTLGDLRAQVAAARTGERRMLALCSRVGTEVFQDSLRSLIAYSELRTRQEIAALPDGTYSATDYTDSDGTDLSGPVRIAVDVTIDGDEIQFDFSRCAEQVESGVNVPLATLRSAVQYSLACMIDSEIPFNDGCMGPVTIVAPSGLIVNPVRPAPVSARHQTSMRVADVITHAMTQVAPNRGSAGWYCGWPYMTCEAASPKTGEPAVLLANILGGGARGRRRRRRSRRPPRKLRDHLRRDARDDVPAADR